MKYYDHDGSGSVTYDEFVHRVMGLERGLLCGANPPSTPKGNPF